MARSYDHSGGSDRRQRAAGARGSDGERWQALSSRIGVVMRLGLLSDIHEAVEPLRSAVHELKARRVDGFVMLGDVLEAGERVEETVAILAPLPGIGVWGSHDMGMCGEVAPSI